MCRPASAQHWASMSCAAPLPGSSCTARWNRGMAASQSPASASSTAWPTSPSASPCCCCSMPRFSMPVAEQKSAAGAQGGSVAMVLTGAGSRAGRAPAPAVAAAGTGHPTGRLPQPRAAGAAAAGTAGRAWLRQGGKKGEGLATNPGREQGATLSEFMRSSTGSKKVVNSIITHLPAALTLTPAHARGHPAEPDSRSKPTGACATVGAGAAGGGGGAGGSGSGSPSSPTSSGRSMKEYSRSCTRESTSLRRGGCGRGGGRDSKQVVLHLAAVRWRLSCTLGGGRTQSGRAYLSRPLGARCLRLWTHNLKVVGTCRRRACNLRPLTAGVGKPGPCWAL